MSKVVDIIYMVLVASLLGMSFFLLENIIDIAVKSIGSAVSGIFAAFEKIWNAVGNAEDVLADSDNIVNITGTSGKGENFWNNAKSLTFAIVMHKSQCLIMWEEQWACCLQLNNIHLWIGSHANELICFYYSFQMLNIYFQDITLSAIQWQFSWAQMSKWYMKAN